jgi:hypothetical protein
MPNPQPFEASYNYLNADIAALSSVIAGGGGGAGQVGIPAGVLVGQVTGDSITINSGLVTWQPNTTVVLPIDTSVPLYQNAEANFFRASFYVDKSVTLTGNEKITISFGVVGVPIRSFYLLDVMQPTASNTYDYYCTGEILMAEGVTSTVGPLTIEIGNITAGPIYVETKAYLIAAGDEKTEVQTNIARYQETFYFSTNIGGVDLCTQINNWKNANPSLLIVAESFTQHNNNQYSAFITYTKK